MRKILIFLMSFIFIFCSESSEKNNNFINQTINHIILKPGATKEIFIQDIVVLDDYQDIEFIDNEDFDISYGDSVLKISPKKDAPQVSSIAFTFKGEKYFIPVIIEYNKKIHFEFKGDSSVKSVSVFGSFNNWNRKSLPMNYNPETKKYEIDLPLAPGSYEYRFFINNKKEAIDPLNPDKVPNPFGEYNSYLKIEDVNKKNIVFMPDNFSNNRLYYRIISTDNISKDDLLIFFNNKRINSYKIVDSRLIINLENNLSKVGYIRIFCRKKAYKKYPYITVLYNGKPAGYVQDFITWYDAIIYSLVTDRFCNGDSTNDNPIVDSKLNIKANYHGGDFQGLINKIDEGYFDSLGVNVLWISPVNDNPNKAYQEWPEPHRYFSGYHGYWPISATRVEEHFGDLELLRNLITKAHNHNKKILLDFVSNHVHIEHPFYKKHKNWFGTYDLPDGRKNIRLWDEYRLTTWFDTFLPSFDYINSDSALETMTDNAIWWLKQTGADGFRHDAVKHVPYKFWRTLKKKLDINFKNKDIFQIGETFGDYNLIRSYVNNGQLSSQFNFNLFFTAKNVFLKEQESFKTLLTELYKTFYYYGTLNLMGNIMDSHDQVRYIAYCENDVPVDGNVDPIEIGWNNPPKVDDALSYKKIQLYLAYMLTIPGIPVIYYGDEIGMTGAADPDNRRDMRFYPNISKEEFEHFNIVKKLIKIRRDNSALRYGNFIKIYCDKDILAYARTDFYQTIIVILNKSSKDKKVTIDFGRYFLSTKCKDLITGNNVILNNMVEMPGFSYKIFKINQK